jgi:hypothetical protein
VKSYIVAFCSVILLVSVGFSQSPAEKDLYEKLAEGLFRFFNSSKGER